MTTLVLRQVLAERLTQSPELLAEIVRPMRREALRRVYGEGYVPAGKAVVEVHPTDTPGVVSVVLQQSLRGRVA